MKRIIVTGAGGALGHAVLKSLAGAGHQLVALVWEAVSPADDLPAVQYLTGHDLTQAAHATDAVAAAMRILGGVDALVNVAGAFTWETIVGGSVASWQRMFDLNVVTALNASTAVLPHLGKGGSIVNIGAFAAERAGAGMAAYTAAKSGVKRLTESLAEEVRDRGIRVNAVMPSIIDTAANRKDMPDADHSSWTSPAAIADVIAFLVSDASRAISGAAIPVTNGA